MNKRKIAAQETRKKLIETAERLIQEKGFDAISVEDITNECGFAKGTFYTYFKRKEDIVLEISRGPFYQMESEILELDATIIERLYLYFERFMQGVQRYGIQICRQWVRNTIDPNQVGTVYDVEKLAFDIQQLRRILQIAVDKGELAGATPIDTLVNIFVCELYGMMLVWCMSDNNFDPKQWTSKFCDTQLQGILKPYLQ